MIHQCILKHSAQPETYEEFIQIQKKLQEEKAWELEKEEMRKKKFATLKNYPEFDQENIQEHPPLSSIIRLDDEQSVEQLYTRTIMQYVARQNIVCTFYCDEVLTTWTDRVVELAKIYTGNTDEQFPHLTLWKSDRPGFDKEWEEKKKHDPNYASQYFLVHLHDEPQNKEELERFISEFKEICYNHIKNHDKK